MLLFLKKCLYAKRPRTSAFFKRWACGRRLALALAASLLILNTGRAWAGDENAEASRSIYHQPQTGLKVELFLQEEGKEVYLCIRFDLPSGAHIYGEDPGVLGLPTTVEWIVPPGYRLGPLEWPVPKAFSLEGGQGYGYTGQCLIKAPFYLNSEDFGSNPLQEPLSLAARVSWLLCNEGCIPGEAKLELELSHEVLERLASQQSSQDLVAQPLPFALPKMPSLAKVLFLAFLGGIILNAMPCVFPVLGLKVLSFVNGNEDQSLVIKLQGLSFGAGVLVSFWMLAGLLLALRSGGEALGWGFQLQSPFFVFLLILLFFILGLNFLNVFSFGTSWMGMGAHLGQRKGYGASFFSGILTCIVAAPCSGPFIGTALGLALSQAGLSSFLIFTSLGVGLALPYVLLSFCPAWLRCLPKPGPWMEGLKEAMAFPLFGSVLWLLWVLGKQKGLTSVIETLWILLFIGLSAWLYGKRWYHSPKALVRVGVFPFLIGVAVFIGYTVVDEGQSDSRFATSWLPYSEARLEALLAEGKPVFIDFTASWCLTCQLNKHRVLESAEIQEAFKAKHVALLRADWTHKDPAIAKKLESFGRSGVPFNVLYTQNPREPLWFFPTMLTQDAVFKALENVKQ